MNGQMRADIDTTYTMIRSYINKTPLIKAEILSDLTGANIYLKCENLQPTGAFKVRGAFSKLLSLTEDDRKKGVIASSTGNHGAAVAFAGRTLSIPVTVFIPDNTSALKIAAIKHFGARLKSVGSDPLANEIAARNLATQQGLTYVSPYNDYQVVCGQATIGYEVNQQLDKIDRVYAAVGGGGLASGIGSYLKTVSPSTKLIGCLPKNSSVMYDSIQAGKIIDGDNQPTLSDSTAGNMDADNICFKLCRDVIDDYYLATEAEIANAVKILFEKEHLLVEGAVGVALAAILQHKQQLKNQNVVLIICGANISADKLMTILNNTA